MSAIDNLVQQKTASTGSGPLLLATLSGCRRFADAFGTGEDAAFFYFIRHAAAMEWEVGTGHMADSQTLVRGSVIASSQGGAKVSFSVGEKYIINDIPASRQMVLPEAPDAGDTLVYDGAAWQAAKPAISSISGLAAALAAKAPAAHGHAPEDISGLTAALAAKAALTHAHAPADIAGLEGLLSDKAAASHNHTPEEIDGLSAALTAKADSAHSHSAADITDLAAMLADTPPAAHGHAAEDIDGLSAALAGKAATSHTHTIGDIEGLGAALDSRAAAVHSHSTGDISGLDAALAAKVPAARSIATTGSLTGGGDLSANRSLSLSGDETSPGSAKYYGTNAGGVKGFHSLPAIPDMPETPDAAGIDFDDTNRVLVTGTNVAAALAAADGAMLRAGFHPRHSAMWNHFNGGEAGGFIAAASGTSANASTPEGDYTVNTDAIGVCRLTTGTTASGAALRGLGTAAMMLHTPGKKLRLLSRIRLANLTAAGSQEIRVWGGVSIGTAATTAPATAIGFYWYYDKDNPNWVLRRRNTSSVSDIDTGIAVAVGVWYDMELTVTGAAADADVSAALSINGTPCAVHTQLIGMMLYNPVSAAIQKVVGTTARLLYLDYEALFVERSA